MDKENPYGTENKSREPLKSLRTYATDMAEAVKEGQGSVLKIAMAENKKRETEQENISPVSSKNRIFIIGGIIFLVLGLGAGGYLIWKAQNSESIEIDKGDVPAPIIFADKAEKIDIKGLSKERIKNRIGGEVRNMQATLDDVTYLYIANSENGTLTKTSANDFLRAIDSGAPAGFLRNLGSDFMTGIHTYDGNNLFIILKVSDFKNGFAGMLSWERTLFDDLYEMFDISIEGENSDLFNRTFEDKIIENRDARVLTGSDGNPVLFYLFLDETTVVIANDRDAVREILTRIKISN